MIMPPLSNNDQPWRKCQEIPSERQKELTRYLLVKPDIANGVYPFADIELDRADIEWLLASHEGGKGPVIWEEELLRSSRMRDGLDLRGAHLQGIDLSTLPLNRAIFGLTWYQWKNATEEERKMAATNLSHANLWGAELRGIRARGARFEGANLAHSYLERAQLLYADLRGTDLQGARLLDTQLEGAILCENGVGPTMLDIKIDADLTTADLSQLTKLGDEILDLRASKAQQILVLQKAVRAYRQVSHALQKQGLDEIADQLLYRREHVKR